MRLLGALCGSVGSLEPAGAHRYGRDVLPQPAPHQQTSTGVYHPLLGTNVEIRVTAAGDSPAAALADAERAEQVALAEMVRLQNVFSVFDPDSELRRWRSDPLLEPPPELVEVLAAAEHWWTVSQGAFHPAIAPLRDRWVRAAADDRVPTDAELSALASSLASLPFTVTDGVVRPTGDCSAIELNAIAKGYIVDRAVAAAEAAGAITVLVNAGGDLRHSGGAPIRVGVEDPAQPGGQPIRVIELSDGALATSGPVHRGFRVAGHWFGHVLDPRTGWPVVERPSTTIRARDAMTADALATVAGVLDPATASHVLAEVPEAAGLWVAPGGVVTEWGSW